jgi:hypothetical protein
MELEMELGHSFAAGLAKSLRKSAKSKVGGESGIRAERDESRAVA